jgi:hypothetical protein
MRLQRKINWPAAMRDMRKEREKQDHLRDAAPDLYRVLKRALDTWVTGVNGDKVFAAHADDMLAVLMKAEGR